MNPLGEAKDRRKKIEGEITTKLESQGGHGEVSYSLTPHSIAHKKGPSGWKSMVADLSGVDCGNSPQKIKSYRLCLSPNPIVDELELDLEDKLRCSFDRVLRLFFESILIGNNCQPIDPPMVGNGQSVDLFKLYFVVREKGGYNAVSELGLWDIVARELGLELDVWPSVKTVYVKYLDDFERWLKGVVEERRTKSPDSLSDNGSINRIELGVALNRFLSDLKQIDMYSSSSCRESQYKGEVKSGALEDKTYSGVIEEPEHSNSKNSLISSSEPGKLSKKDTLEYDEAMECIGNNEEHMPDSNMYDKDSNKRKRDSTWDIIDWITKVAKDPCDPAIDSLPERSKWNSFGKNELWKQVLAYRKAMCTKRHLNSTAENMWQKSLKMHPCMYDDHIGTNYKFRDRLSCTKKPHSDLLASKASSWKGPKSNAGKSSNPARTEKGSDPLAYLESEENVVVPLGPSFQAAVPEWTGVASESDPKWLGTLVWPAEKVVNKFLTERDPIGKGRHDLCGCHIAGSVECVRFHIKESTLKLKRELGSAFYDWKFDQMGEEVGLSWSEEEQKKFNTAVTLKPPPSVEDDIWKRIYKAFPAKSREELVSYYYNVLILQRRAFQNRNTPTNINSDDDEDSELENDEPAHQKSKSNSFILRTPRETHKKS